jgi:hypothetical protein
MPSSAFFPLESYGPEHPKVAIDLNNLALLLKDTNRLGKPSRSAADHCESSLSSAIAPDTSIHTFARRLITMPSC